MRCALWFLLGWLAAVGLIAPMLTKHFEDDDPDFL